MVAWLLTRIFSSFYYRGQQRKLEKQLSELWDAYHVELRWLKSYAADLLSNVPDHWVTVIAIKRLEERGCDTFWLEQMLEQVDAELAGRVSMMKHLHNEQLESLLLTIREREREEG